MVSRTPVTLNSEMHRRASELGVSLGGVFRRLVSRDLARPETKPDVDRIFDLGDSSGSVIALNKTDIIARALASSRKRSR
jgi:hypothetical protein